MPDNIQFNVKITNAQLPAKTRINLINTAISGQARYAPAGFANFYYGPPMPALVLTDVLIDAPGYAPYSYFAETGQLLQFGNQDLTVVCTLTPSFNRPFGIAPRFWKGNMCGVRIPGAPNVPGNQPNDPALILDWFYGKYSSDFRPIIRDTWQERRITHCLQSWPDMRAAGQNADDFIGIVLELGNFYPCVMLSSKDFDVPDVNWILDSISELIPKLVQVKIPMICIGWELSLWLTPTQVQQLIDAITPFFTPIGTKCYVHFQEGYGSFQQPGHIFADFWNVNIGKLTGVLHQKVLAQSHDQYRYDSGGLVDILHRFSGSDFCSDESGFGHPFDCVALEITASNQFNNGMPESVGDEWGTWAINSPHIFGPNGVEAYVMGSGNGFQI